MVVGDSGIIYRNENISVGKTESYEHIEFNIYPNPVRQGIFIETHLSSNITIELSNALGQKIQHLVTSKNKSYIDLSENSSGLYFISVQSGNDKLIRKIIKE
jgi:hypothetical protein